MELTNGLNKRVVEMYKGGELVWEMPATYIRVGSMIAGTYVIKGNVHPAGAKVTCKSGIKEYAVDVNYNDFTINFDEPLTKGRMFKFTVEMPGWKESFSRLTVS